jgi:DNA/RNA-binding domain of Phe-tRNA-synthetase-like protein
MSAKKTAAPMTSRRVVEALRRKAARGQAMVEYSVVSHAILFFGAATIMPIMSKLFENFTKFYESIFFVLNRGAI